MGAPTQAEIEDFASRNVNADGSKDYHRAVEALTNYTGDRDFDSQGPMYDQRTNQLSAAGRAATAQIVRPQPRSLASLLQPMAPRGPMPGQPGNGPAPDPTSYGNDQRSYPMPAPLGGAFTDFTQGRGPVIGYGPQGEPIYAPVSTTMPVGQRPQLANLL